MGKAEKGNDDRDGGSALLRRAAVVATVAKKGRKLVGELWWVSRKLKEALVGVVELR